MSKLPEEYRINVHDPITLDIVDVDRRSSLKQAKKKARLVKVASIEKVRGTEVLEEVNSPMEVVE